MLGTSTAGSDAASAGPRLDSGDVDSIVLMRRMVRSRRASSAPTRFARSATDGSEPNPAKNSGTARFDVEDTTTVKAVLLVGGKKVGKTAEVTYRKRTPPVAGDAIALGALSEPTTLEAVLPLLARGDAMRGRAVFQAAGCAG